MAVLHRCRRHQTLRGLAMTAGAIVLASGAAGPASAASTARAHARSILAPVPWRKAGPGWAIADYSASTAPMVRPARKGPVTLYLTSPRGRAYPFYVWPAKSRGASAYWVVDWSGDRRRVLLSSGTTMEQISLATRRVAGRFDLPAGVSPISYTRPRGLALLASRTYRGRNQIVRLSLSGHLERVLATGKDATWAIDSPSGVSVIVANGRGLEQVSNSGAVMRYVRAPIAVYGCQPVRWWNSTTVLGSCTSKGRNRSRLWLFPVGGGRVRALTPQRSVRSPDLGDIEGWRLTSGLYLQALGACGTESIMKQASNGSVRAVDIPGTPNISNHIVTGLRARLLVSAITGCGGSSSLLWFNPGTRTVRYVLRTPASIAGVRSSVAYGHPLTN